MKWDWLEQRIIDCGYNRKTFAEAIGWHTVRLSEMIANTITSTGAVRRIPYKRLKDFAEKLKIDSHSLYDYNDDLRTDVVFFDINKDEDINTPNSQTDIQETGGVKMKWDWLKQRITDCGYTRKEFSDTIKWDKSRLSEMIKNSPVNGGKIRNIPYKKLQMFAELLKIDQKSLHEYNDDKRNDVVFLDIDNPKDNDVLNSQTDTQKTGGAINTDELVSIDIIDAKACRGDDIENLSDNAIGQQMMTPAALKAYTKTNPDDVKIINAIGDSMSPTINSGDMVWIDISCQTPRADGLYVIVIGDAMSIKRLQINPFTGSVTIKSDNQRYDDYTADTPDDIRVVGKIIYHVRRVG